MALLKVMPLIGGSSKTKETLKSFHVEVAPQFSFSTQITLHVQDGVCFLIAKLCNFESLGVVIQ